MKKTNETFYNDYSESCKVALETYAAKQEALALAAKQKAAANKAAKRKASRKKRAEAKKRRKV